MWAAVTDNAVHLYANDPTHNVADFILAAHPGAELKKTRHPAWNEFQALVNEEKDVYHDPVVTEQPLKDSDGNPVLGADGEPLFELATGPITVTRVAVGRTWALESGNIVVRDAEGAEVKVFALVKA